MHQLFLTAYFANTAALLPPFLGEDCRGKRVSFIPTAALPETVTFYVDEARNALTNMGIIVEEVDVAALTADEIAATLARNDYLYVSGGNTFFLLQQLRQKQADTALLAHINAGKPYIGESAGSMILAADIGYVRELDDVALAPDWMDDRGLAVLDVAPLPHDGEFPFAEATARVKQLYGDTLSLCPLNNDQVLCIQNGRQQILSKAA